MDLTINNKPTSAMVLTGATHNFMTESEAKILELKFAPSNSHLKTVNVDLQNAHSVDNGVGIILDQLEGTKNFTSTTNDIFDIILGRKFFRLCPTLIDPYLQCLLVLEHKGSCMVPIISIPHSQIQVQVLVCSYSRDSRRGNRC